MKPSGKKMLVLLVLLLFLIPLCMAVRKVYRAVRQPELNATLLATVKKNDTAAAFSLLAQGADANARDIPADTQSMWQKLWDRISGKPLKIRKGPTALLVAATWNLDNPRPLLPGNGPMVKALLDAGANVNTAGTDARTPLIWTAMTPRSETASLLLARGADVNARDYSGTTALHWAAGAGNLALVRLLLSRGAVVNAKNSVGSTPLQRAAMFRKTDIVRLLIANGADVNVRDSGGRTPLAWTAHMNQSDCFKLLLAKGARMDTKDKRGMTPLRIAREDNNEQMVKMLKKASAKE